MEVAIILVVVVILIKLFTHDEFANYRPMYNKYLRFIKDDEYLHPYTIEEWIEVHKRNTDGDATDFHEYLVWLLANQRRTSENYRKVGKSTKKEQEKLKIVK